MEDTTLLGQGGHLPVLGTLGHYQWNEPGTKAIRWRSKDTASGLKAVLVHPEHVNREWDTAYRDAVDRARRYVAFDDRHIQVLKQADAETEGRCTQVADELWRVLQDGGVVFVVLVAPREGIEYPNYRWLPDRCRIRNDLFQEAVGADAGAPSPQRWPFLAALWKAIEDRLAYTAYLREDPPARPPDISRALGALTPGFGGKERQEGAEAPKPPEFEVWLRNQQGRPIGILWTAPQGEPPGRVVYLPDSPLPLPELVAALRESAARHLSAEPSWVAEYAYPCQGTLEAEDAECNRRLEDVRRRQAHQNQWRRLLYEKGDGLAEIVRHALAQLGIDAPSAEVGEEQIDGVYAPPGERPCMFEISGKAGGAIGMREVGDLLRKRGVYQRERADMLRGVHVGNGYARQPVGERPDQFDANAVRQAKDNAFGLLTTSELFKAVSYALEHPEDEKFKAQVRQQLLSDVGLIRFQIPGHGDES